ncbi:hypothetical protein SCAR479_03143 [Seiridium cardinale]|uniref:S-adenosyl-L-methionine-dependent N-methyltransferase n=1 Tax=Seiridium cardinale TaxID=138064 RepID=A0ABR2Y1W4_9PEZI
MLLIKVAVTFVTFTRGTCALADPQTVHDNLVSLLSPASDVVLPTYIVAVKPAQVDDLQIVLEENEAVAKVEIPQNQPHRCESTTWRKCDAVVLDTCIHIGGLIINTIDAISNDEVAVMVGLNRSVISPSFTMDSGTKWSVYATCEFSDNQNQVFGDIFVFSQEDYLVAMFSGCRMSRVPIVKLEKALDSALSTSRRAKIEAGPDQPPPMSHSSTRISSTHEINTPSSQAQQSNELPQHRVDAVEALRQLISDSTMIDKADVSEKVSGTPRDDIQSNTMLADLGVDSLSLMDLKQELEEKFPVMLDVQMAATVQEIMAALGLDPVKQLSLANVPPQAQQPPTKQGDLLKSLFQINPFHVMEQLGLKFDEAASENGILGYWNNVAPLQDEITVAHIVEAFASFGVDFKVLESGQLVSNFSYLSPKYDKLVRRCWEFLQKQDIISISEEMLDVGQRKSPRVLRGSKSINPKPAAELLRDFHSQFPAYTHETKLMELTGPKLADCLSGSVDSVSLMFGSAQSSQIMENYYSCSPLTKSRAVDRPVRILEVGAGTVSRLSTHSPKSKSKFQHQFPWIKYSTLNLEVDVGSEFLGRFDVAVATNVVHATRDRTAACRRIRETLTPAGGLFILAETTTKINWCDICFGLLDGWWFSDGPIGPLQTAHEWAESLQEAGFASVGYSRGSTADVNTVQLVVGSNADWPATFAATTAPRHMSDLDTSARLEPKGKPRAGGYHLETMVYKEAEGVPIHADVYYPQSTPSSRMPIALMIHGGGYVTLSRRAVRPEQTRYLLKRGLLPVSIDYRLCPEVNIIDGPMTDVRDAYRWSRDILPGIASNAGVLVDRSSIVAIGWSTGGQLAMSLGWTAEYAGLPPPSAVLSFYAPVDFESRERPGKRIPNLDEPSPERIAFISPLAHLRLGTYNVPTFIIHGTNDEVAPFAAAKHFAESFERNGKKGIQCGFLPLQDTGHLFDLRLAEGSGGWEAMVAPGSRL